MTVRLEESDHIHLPKVRLAGRRSAERSPLELARREPPYRLRLLDASKGFSIISLQLWRRQRGRWL